MLSPQNKYSLNKIKCLFGLYLSIISYGEICSICSILAWVFCSSPGIAVLVLLTSKILSSCGYDKTSIVNSFCSILYGGVNTITM